MAVQVREEQGVGSGGEEDSRQRGPCSEKAFCSCQPLGSHRKIRFGSFSQVPGAGEGVQTALGRLPGGGLIL